MEHSCAYIVRSLRYWNVFLHISRAIWRVPATLKGTVADPQTFMTERELLLSDDFQK